MFPLYYFPDYYFAKYYFPDGASVPVSVPVGKFGVESLRRKKLKKPRVTKPEEEFEIIALLACLLTDPY